MFFFALDDGVTRAQNRRAVRPKSTLAFNCLSEGSICDDWLELSREL